VLSNNDGCAVARSEEAKALGIQMGAPEFMVRDTLKAHNVAVFSSNYTLYGDMSDRVMKTLAAFVPRLELYSIDEAFLDMSELKYNDLLKLGMEIKNTVKQHVGIPVTVGIAPTKALAKIANRYAKKKHKDLGVHWLANSDLIKQALVATEVGDIWGIGRRYETLLQRYRVNTAFDFINLPEEWIRVNMTVVGQRLWNELRGVQSFEWEFEIPAKKNICTSRSFGKLVNRKDEMIEALSNYAASCAAKLRRQKSAARLLHVFIKTNQHRMQDKQYGRSINIQLPIATNNTVEIVKHALKGLDIIFKEGYNFNKCGVIVSDLVPEESIQYNLFDTANRHRNTTVMKTMDKLNASLGKDLVRFAVQGFEKRYKLRAEYLSKLYTTNLADLPTLRN